MAVIITLSTFSLGYIIKADVFRLANSRFILSENGSSK